MAMNKVITTAAVWGLAVLLATVPVIAGQKPKASGSKPAMEVVLAGPQYSGSISGRASSSYDEAYNAIFYTNDSIEKVKSFYEQKTGLSVAMEPNGTAKICRDVTFTSNGRTLTRNGCIRIRSKKENGGPFHELEQGLEGPALGMSSPTDTEYRDACRKYAYLAELFFPMRDGLSGPVAKALYDKIVAPVNKKVDAEAKQQDKESRGQTASAATPKGGAEDEKAKRERIKEIKEQLRQLKKEGKTDEIIALNMQLIQEQQGTVSMALAEGSQNQEKGLERKKARADEKHRAYIQFLQALTNETSFTTQISIDHVEGDTGG